MLRAWTIGRLTISASSGPPAISLGTAPALVTLSGVEKRFSNGTLALAAVDIAVHDREFLSIVGPSGCGKSTILRLIAGLTSPSAGAVEWPAKVRLDLGFVFQEPTLMPWARVLDNVTLPLRLAGTKRVEAEARAVDTLRLVGLDKFLSAYPRELSGGMKMRASIARALVTRPKLLLMDEPFAALDEITRLKLNDDLIELWQSQAVTVVFVTHSIFEAVYLSQRVVAMSGRPGRVTAEVAIPAPQPRGRAFRFSTDYAAGAEAVQAALGLEAA